MYRIYIVEDDVKIRTILKKTLEKYGLEALTATGFKELMPELIEYDPHLVLLDINLPYYDGYYWCRQIRARSNLPIIFLSARSGEMDQVMAIEHGGDDYITKPIRLELLIAKVKGVLRRAYGEYAKQMNEAYEKTSELSLNMVEAAGLRLDLGRNELHFQGSLVTLTQNEQLLARCLLERYASIVSREKLLECLWNDTQFVDDNTLTVNVTRLRKKLEEIGLPHAIVTVRGQGYRLDAEDPGRLGTAP
ncbi:DNA-binding response regulator [Paenibacillus sp. CAA11]|uniref:response regulator transcription factor n=1 Tax=Paenibacillus sp. CAA11 TaxID=1532905 RepID=UPI000D370DE6|nr:response regulator transcription factor [Paenibacillus sp. CAA11]AWB44772.1 DNA-binding response regulator [Paenibacillus sp. CAA11]